MMMPVQEMSLSNALRMICRFPFEGPGMVDPPYVFF